MPFHQGLTRAQGDPGFFGTIGRIARKLGRSIPGPIGGFIGEIFPNGPGPPTFVPPPPTMNGRVDFGGGQFPGVGGGGGRGSTLPSRCPSVMECPKGMRPNKSAYFIKGGQFVAPGTRCVKIRRINPGNGRAVRRAIRRENSFVRLAVGTGLVTVPKAKRVRKAAGKSRR